MEVEELWVGNNSPLDIAKTLKMSPIEAEARVAQVHKDLLGAMDGIEDWSRLQRLKLFRQSQSRYKLISTALGNAKEGYKPTKEQNEVAKLMREEAAIQLRILQELAPTLTAAGRLRAGKNPMDIDDAMQEFVDDFIKEKKRQGEDVTVNVLSKPSSEALRRATFADSSRLEGLTDNEGEED